MRIEQPGPGSQTAVASVKPLGLPAARELRDAQNHEEHTPRGVRVQQAQEMTPKNVHPVGSTLKFSIDAESGRVVVKVINNATQELVRQIPMEEMLALAKRLDQLKGLLLHTEA